MYKKFKFLFAACGFAAVLAAAPKAHAATEFQMAAQLLAAARAGDVQNVQALVQRGANINYVDRTGLSIVCTALMNNDVRAAQILQMHGADASRCDQQIRRYRQRLPRNEHGGMFSGLSTAQNLVLAGAAAAGVVGGIWLLSDVLAPKQSFRGPGGGGGGTGCMGGPPCPTGQVCCPGEGCRVTCSGNLGAIRWWVYTPDNSRGIPCGPAQVAAGQCPPTDFNPPGAQAWFADAQSAVAEAAALVGTGTINDFNILSRILVDPDATEQIRMSMQNYLLLMGGYGSLARGYSGYTTLRGGANLQFMPTDLGGATFNGFPIGGGQPVSVALISAHGVNTLAGSPDNPGFSQTSGGSSIQDGWLYWADRTVPSGEISPPGPGTMSRRFFNNRWGGDQSTVPGMTGTLYEDTRFDLSGAGTAIENQNATAYDNILAKIIIGGIANGATVDVETRDGFGDYTGFIPNGQLVLYRTGGGMTFTADVVDTGISANGTTFVSMTTIDIAGVTYDAAFNSTTGIFTLTAAGQPTLTGWIMQDGTLYVDTGAGGTNVFFINGSEDIVQAGTWNMDIFKNYTAMLSAINLPSSVGTNPKLPLNMVSGNLVGVIANAAPIDSMYAQNAWTISDFQSFPVDAARSGFLNLINNCYGGDCRVANLDTTVLLDAGIFFSNIGPNGRTPLVIFSTGGYLIGSFADLESGATAPGRVLEANIENAAPLAFNNLDHYFMSAVAVQLNGNAGTSGANPGNVPDWNDTLLQNNTQKIVLSTWVDPYADPNALTSDVYRARKCGIAGIGTLNVDPWCFAAAGQTDMMAVAALAGAAGAMQSAFGSYMTNDQIFVLMALTSDGRQMAEDELMAKYDLPPEIWADVNNPNTSTTFMDGFADVFGYGLVNLSLATQPGAFVYYYAARRNNNLNQEMPAINHPSGDAFWSPTRIATAAGANTARSATMLSGAFGARNASIKIPMFDFIESVDGSMSMPRIFDASVPLTADRRSIHTGDALGDFKIDNTPVRSESGGVTFGMSFRDVHREDGFGSLDKLSLEFDSGRFALGAKFERNAGDTNILRGDDANPIMAIASNMMSADALYRSGGWRIGMRAAMGAVTEEGLLAHDPMIDSQRDLLKLGDVFAFESGIAYSAFGMSFGANVGTFRESDTLLGSFTDGLVSMAGGNTMYIENLFEYRATDKLRFNARYTAARTTTGAHGADTIIMNMSDLYSDAMSVGMEFGGWSFNLARPLAVTSGSMQYITADLELVESDRGFDLSATPYIENFDLSPDVRELRASLAYRRKLGEFTSGAVGFVYRNNPNHTREFGDEALFMLKLSHRLGI